MLKNGILKSKGLMGRVTSTCPGLAGCDKLQCDGLASLWDGLHGAEMDKAWLNVLDLQGAAERSLSSVEMSCFVSSDSRSRIGDLGISSSSVDVATSMGLRGERGLDGELSIRGSELST